MIDYDNKDNLNVRDLEELGDYEVATDEEDIGPVSLTIGTREQAETGYDENEDF